MYCHDLALGSVEPQEVHPDPPLEPVYVSVDGILSFQHDCTTQLGVTCKQAEGAFDSTVAVTDEDVKDHWFQH